MPPVEFERQLVERGEHRHDTGDQGTATDTL